MPTPTAPMPPFIASFIRIGGKTIQEHYADVRKITEGNALQNIIEVNTDAEMDEAKAFARTIVPVLTGYLRSSIDWEKLGRLLYRFSAAADYAGYVEYGTYKMGERPYMTPALLRLKQRLPQLIITDVSGIFK